MIATIQRFEFEGRRLPAVRLRGSWWLRARDLAQFAGGNEREFMRRSTDVETEEGVDFIRVRGVELHAVRVAVNEAGDSPMSTGRGGPREMVLLSESGAHLALMRARSAGGRRLRRWLAREVLPSLRATGTYSTDAAPEISRLEHERDASVERALIAERRCAALEHADRVIGSGGKTVGAEWAHAHIDEPILQLARRRAAGPGERGWRSWHRAYSNRVRARVPHNMKGSRWGNMPADPRYVAPVVIEISAIASEVAVAVSMRTYRAALASRGQLSLFRGEPH